MLKLTDLHGKSDTELIQIIHDLGSTASSEQRFRSILDDLAEGFIIIGFDWKYLYVNKMAVVYSRMPAQEMLGYTVHEKFPGTQNTHFFGEMEVCMHERKSLTFESRLVYDDLSVRWFEIHLQPVKDGISVMMIDISVRRYNETQMNRSKDLLVRKIELRTHQLQSSNKDLTDSILYARQIQKAFLPPVTDIERLFPDSFVFLQPKDLVSGDFFWMRKIKSKTIIAVADCTGHGVPGALLSIIGAQSLCEAVENSFDPAEILTDLNKRMKRALRQSDDPRSTRDGMDIAVCVFDNDISTLEFAGANRPLWLIRRNSGELREFKGNRTAIGGRTENDHPFEMHTMELYSGDCIYLSSDGFADQDGGANGKKLKSKNFKELLVKISDYSMPEQKRRLTEFSRIWKGDKPQLDDMLVAGIRV